MSRPGVVTLESVQTLVHALKRQRLPRVVMSQWGRWTWYEVVVAGRRACVWAHTPDAAERALFALMERGE